MRDGSASISLRRCVVENRHYSKFDDRISSSSGSARGRVPLSVVGGGAERLLSVIRRSFGVPRR